MPDPGQGGKEMETRQFVLIAWEFLELEGAFTLSTWLWSCRSLLEIGCKVVGMHVCARVSDV